MGWLQSVVAQRQRAARAGAGGDFSAELGEILALSRVREDSRAMQQSVRHAAARYPEAWTGVASP